MAQPPPLPKNRRKQKGSPSGPPPLVPPVDMRLLATLPTLPLRAKYLMEGFLLGKHRSPLKGSSIEFAEYRAYQQGDDLRRVDWRLWGRSDRMNIRVYEEETQMPVTLLLDTSASMNYRSRPEVLKKLDYARTVLAAVACLVQRQQDAVGFACLESELSGYLAPRSSLAHLRALIARIDHPRNTTGTYTSAGLTYLAGLLRRRSLLLVASDFYEELADLSSAVQRLRYDGHDVVAFQVLDPQEVDFDTAEPGFFVDNETGHSIPVNPAEARNSYLKEFRAFQADLQQNLRGLGADLVTLRTDEPPIEALSAYLAHRERLV